MSPYPQIESASMLTKLIISSKLCHNDTIYEEWVQSINYCKGDKPNFGQNLKSQSAVVTLNIRSRSSDQIKYFLYLNNVSMQVWWKSTD